MDRTSKENRIGAMIDAIKKVARVDYSIQIELSGKNDEFDSLAIAINMMIDNIRKDITEHKRVEEALKESQRYTRELIETSLDPLVTISFDGKITDVNRATELVTGYTRDKLVGTDFSDYFTDPQRARQGYNHVFKNKYIRDYSLEIRHRDGKITPVLYNATVYCDRKGNIAGVFAIARDITERRQAEERIRLFSQAVDSSVDGVAIGNLEGRITYVNEAFVKMFGYSPEKLIGKAIPFIYPEDQLSKLEKALKATKQGGWTGELVGKRKNGELFPIALSSSLIKDNKGTIIAQMAIHRDITEHKQAEEKLKFLSSAVEQSHDGIAVASLEGNLLFVNHAWTKMHGYELSEELLGKQLKIFHNKEQTEKDVIPFNQKVMEKGSNTGEVGHIHKDGTPFPTQMSTTLLKDSQGKPIAIVGIARDITERKNAEEALKRKNEELERFNRIAVGRELKMVELKKEINTLLKELGKEPQYKIPGESIIKETK